MDVQYTKKDFALGYAKLLNAIEDQISNLATAKDLYDRAIAITTIEIWSNKAYLKDCTFSKSLLMNVVVDLSNDTLRKSALTLACQYDSQLSEVKTLRDQNEKTMNYLLSVKDAFSRLLDLSEGMFGTIAKADIPASVVEWLPSTVDF